MACLVSDMEVAVGAGVFLLIWGFFFPLIPLVYFLLVSSLFFFFFKVTEHKAKCPACLVSGPTVCVTKAGNAETVMSSCRASRLSFLHKTAEYDIIGLINPARLPGLFPYSLCFSEGGTRKNQDRSVAGDVFIGTGGRCL